MTPAGRERPTPARTSRSSPRGHALSSKPWCAAIGVGARVAVDESDDELLVTCTGGDLGLLIGKHGQTIDALQYVANAADVPLRRAEVGDDRRGRLSRAAARRRSSRSRCRAADRAARGERVELDPMTAVERKVVHERLKDVDGVETDE